MANINFRIAQVLPSPQHHQHMSKRLAGRFYFDRTSNGNLVGEFSNNQGPNISTESCDLQGNSIDFVGKYHSTWQEDGEPLFADLEIARKGKLFTLEWTRGGIVIFKGDGMLSHNTLTGDYRCM